MKERRPKNPPTSGAENATTVAGKNPAKRKQFSRVTVPTDSYEIVTSFCN